MVNTVPTANTCSGTLDLEVDEVVRAQIRRPRRSVTILTVVSLLATVLLFVVVGCASRTVRASPAGSPPVVAVGPTGTSDSARPPRPTAVPTLDPTATPIPTVAAATDLGQQTIDGHALPSGGWAISGVVLSFRAPAVAGQALIPQVEVVKAGQPFQGAPTAEGSPVPAKAGWATGTITLKGLAPGEYAWQARFRDAETHREGSWQQFAAGGVAYGIVGPPPSIQNLSVTGTSHTVGGVPVAGAKDEPAVRWSVSDSLPIALDRLAYEADHQQLAPRAPPSGATTLSPTVQTLSLSNLDDGAWYLHLWAIDKAGQVSQPVTVPITVMRVPTKAVDVVFRSWATNPLYQSIPIHFAITRAATVVVSILPASSTTPIRQYDLGRQPADRTISVTWDGKDSHGQIVSPGSYRFLIGVADDAGNYSQVIYDGLTVTDKVIKVSLGTQTLTAYDGNTPFLTTLITSGGADLPTPVGQFEILEKASPFIFHSPYPKGSKFWYPDVKSNYAMLFDQPDADFIHDAPWRSKFGPGTNGPGVPGQVYTGSHGCVETPVDVMPRLFPWTPLGTPVIVSQ